jgi:Bifunctional DNA primase/polymerase, N-terminal
MTDMLTAALEYASNGLLVFPVNPVDKSPLCARGFKAASVHEPDIQAWWTRHPNAMIGFRTGAYSWVWVVDVDVDRARGINGRAAMARLEANHGALPQTLTSATPRGGTQLFFQWIDNLNIPTSCSRIGHGIDVRANGGYVVLPPSVRADGTPYRWLTAMDHPIAQAPQWLINLGRKRSTPVVDLSQIPNETRRASSSARDYVWAHRALEQECTAIAAALPGTRNAALNRGAFNLFQIVAGGSLGEQEVCEQLFAAAEANGSVADDGATQVWKTINSAARAAQPRYRPR